MDMLRANRLQRITKAEDEARALRNILQRQKDGPVSAHTLALLADAVAQGLQAIRESL